MKATNQELVEAYQKTKSIWVVARQFGMCGQSVHERLQKLSVVLNGHGNRWTPEDDQLLRHNYEYHASVGTLALLAKQMGRTRHFICRQARALGLTKKSRQRRWLAVHKYMTESEAREWIKRLLASRTPINAFMKRYGLSVIWQITMKRLLPAEWEAVAELKSTSASMYKRGRSFEYRVRDKLRACGYFVLRSPQSRGVADLVAIGSGRVLFINCKLRGACPPADWNRTFDAAEQYNATPILAQTRKTGRGIEILRMTGRKIGKRGATQPMAPYEFEDDARIGAISATKVG